MLRFNVIKDLRALVLDFFFLIQHQMATYLQKNFRRFLALVRSPTGLLRLGDVRYAYYNHNPEQVRRREEARERARQEIDEFEFHNGGWDSQGLF